jgi:hypothetical protein
MNRPLYETDADLQREQAVIDRICKGGQRAEKLPIHNHLDYAIFNGNTLAALVEIRCRNNFMTKYPTFFCNLSKVMSARQLSEACNTPAYLFVQWSDRLAYINFDAPYTVQYGGRNQMRDWQDKGLLAHFEIGLFKGVGNE